MRQKSQKGVSLIELLITVAIILIIAAIAVPNVMNHANFKESFGIDKNSVQSNEERQIIQPLITKRIQELRNNLQIAQKEKTDLLNLPPQTVTPEETTQRINKLKEIEAKTTSASDMLDNAINSADHFGFKL